MKLYLLLSSGGGVSRDAGERAAAMKELTAWFGRLGNALVDGGAALTGNVKGVSSDGKVTGGAGAAAVNGYMVIRADSMEAAIGIAQGYPFLRGGFNLTVYETFKDG